MKLRTASHFKQWPTLLLLFIFMLSPFYAAKAKAQFTDSDACILVINEDTQVDLQADGRYLKTTRAVYKILGVDGIKKLNKRHFAYHKHYNRIEVKIARVIKSDQREVTVPEDSIYDVSSLSLSKMNIYDENARTKIIVFKDLEVGDTIEMLIVETGFNPPMKGAYSEITLFQDFYPIVQKTYRLSTPVDLKIYYAMRNGKADFSKTVIDDRAIYQWQVRQLDRMDREPAMPPLVNFAPRLVVSTIEKWEEISRWYYHLTQPRMTIDGNLSNVTEELTSHLQSDREKVEAIFRYVSSNIRYMGLGTGANRGYIPKPVSETYQTQYGICRDVAALMTAMLNHVGIEAYITLTSQGYDMEKKIPTLLFNHAIVAIKLDDDPFIFADPTVKNSPTLLAPQGRDQDVLIATQNGQILARTPGIKATENMAYINAVSEIAPNGDLTSNITYNAQGIYLSYLQYAISAASQGGIESWIQNLLQARFPGAVVAGYRFVPASSGRKGISLKFEFKVKNYGVLIDNLMQFKSPLSQGRFDILANRLLKSASLSERRYEWNLGTTFGVSEEETIIYPEEYTLLSKPDSQKLSQGVLHYQIDYSPSPSNSDDKKRLSYRKKLFVDKKCLSTKEYKHLKFILKAADRAAKGEVILMKI